MNLEKTRYFGVFELGGRNLWLAATDRGLSFVGTEEHWLSWRQQGACMRDEGRLELYAAQLEQYFRGERRSFQLPLDVEGTAFQQAVWHALTDIPFGARASYTDIALAIGKPTSARAVGAAIGANPALIVVPCHRVVGKNGSLTGFREGLAMKRQLLGLEAPLETAAR